MQYGSALAEAPMVGDRLAMDLLNTEVRNGSEVADYWQSGEDVVAVQIAGFIDVLADTPFFRLVKKESATASEQCSDSQQFTRRLITGRCESQFSLRGTQDYLIDVQVRWLFVGIRK